jgi:RNA polymerase sigma factor (sigma-70 family)
VGAHTYDPALLTAARDGDRQSILTLLEVAQPEIRRYATRACETSDDASDAVQEALWILYRRVGTLRAITSFSAWLLATVRRECWRLAQRARGINIPLEEAEAYTAFANRPQLELRIDLARAIESLPEHYREIVLLRDIEELTIDEIANSLGRTREAVKANLHRSRVLLREYLCGW